MSDRASGARADDTQFVHPGGPLPFELHADDLTGKLRPNGIQDFGKGADFAGLDRPPRLVVVSGEGRRAGARGQKGGRKDKGTNSAQA